MVSACAHPSRVRLSQRESGSKYAVHALSMYVPDMRLLIINKPSRSSAVLTDAARHARPTKQNPRQAEAPRGSPYRHRCLPYRKLALIRAHESIRTAETPGGALPQSPLWHGMSSPSTKLSAK